MTDDIMKRIMVRMVIWMAVSMTISMAVNFGMFYAFGDAAFPWNIFVMMGLFLFMGYLISKRQLKKAGMLGAGGGGFGGIFGGMKRGKSYVCYACSTKYKGSSCPNCGARGGRMVFD